MRSAEPPPRCAAIVPTVGRPDALDACLAALRGAAVPFSEVWVVDQSGDPAIAAACARHRALRVVPAARGLSLARNVGVRSAASEWLYFPDDDCVPDGGFLAAIAAGIGAHPDARFFCGRVADGADRPLNAGMGDAPFEIRTARQVFRAVVSAGLVVHREVLERVGGFDERLGVGARWPSGEESDLLLRARRAGARGWYLPDARVFHPAPFEIRDPRGQAARAHAYGRGWGALFAKHGVRGGEPALLALYAAYLARAAGGAVAGALTLRFALARRSAASLAGRVRGFLEYLASPEGRP